MWRLMSKKGDAACLRLSAQQRSGALTYAARPRTCDRAAAPSHQPAAAHAIHSHRGTPLPTSTSMHEAARQPVVTSSASSAATSGQAPRDTSTTAAARQVRDTTAAAFHAYLRVINDPFTAATSGEDPSVQSSRTLSASVIDQRRRGDDSREWLVQPGLSQARGRGRGGAGRDEEEDARKHHSPGTPRHSAPQDAAGRRHHATTGRPDRRHNARETEEWWSLAQRDDHHVTTLRETQREVLHRRESMRLVEELRQALCVLHDAEKALFDFTTTSQAPDRVDDHDPRADAAAAASSDQREETRRYRADAFMFERVGQIQRTLRTLHARHFHAAADAVHTSVGVGKGAAPHKRSTKAGSPRTPGVRLLLDLLETLVRVLTYLAHLSQHATAHTTAPLPRQLVVSARADPPRRATTAARYVFLPGLLPPTHVESAIRNTAALFALREVCRVLVALDNETWGACMAHVVQHGVQPPPAAAASNGASSSSSSAPPLLLRSPAILRLLDAALTLPSDDALRVPALVPAAPPTATGTAASSAPPRADAIVVWKPVEVPLEEWCLHRWIYFQTLRLRVLEEAAAAATTAATTTTQSRRDATEYVPSWLEAQTLSPRQWAAVLRIAMSAVEDPSNLLLRATTTSVLSRAGRGAHGSGASGPDRQTLRIPFGVGKTFTMLFLRHLTTRSAEHVNLDDLHIRDVATLCTAVLFFDVLTTEALHVLVQAAPRCVEDVHALRGWEISDMLLAYASLKYDGNVARPATAAADSPAEPVNFYVVLGTRAGQLGETLSTHDTTRVLRALEMVGIEHETLRRSFESSLRMRAVTHRQHLV